VTLVHRRADLRETMSDYLVREIERYGVAVRDRSEIAALHGTEGRLEEVTLKGGERLRFAFLFLFLGVGTDNLLGTTVPGVFAVGDVRSGSTKRCATAVGEGAWAVQLVHAHLAGR